MLITTATVAKLISENKYDKAQEQLKQLLLVHPNMDELYDLYVYCQKCMQNGQNIKSSPEKVEKWIEMLPYIQKFIDKGNFTSAINMFRLLSISEEVRKKQFYECADLQDKTKINYLIAICYYLQGIKEKAKEYYINALDAELSALYIQWPEAISILMKKQEYYRALQEIDNFLKGSACDAQLCYQRYEIFKELGDEAMANECLDDVLTALEEDLRMHPLSAPLYKQYADILILQGRFEKALSNNGNAVALQPNSYTYQAQRAEIYARNGQKDEALEILSLMEKGNMGDVAKIRPALTAKVYECLGDLETAEQYYKAPAILPLFRYEELAAFYKRHGRKKDRKILRQEQRKDPFFQNRVSENMLIDLVKKH